MRVNALRLRAVMGRDEWLVPEPYGPDGFRMLHRSGDCTVIVSCSPLPVLAQAGDHTEWLHASMTRPERVPLYDDMCRLHLAVWGETGYAYQAHVPTARHVNIHPYALHLWGRADGAAVLPDFGFLGTI